MNMNMFNKNKSFSVVLVLAVFLTTGQAFSSIVNTDDLNTSVLNASVLKTSALSTGALGATVQKTLSKNSFYPKNIFGFAKLALVGSVAIVGTVAFFLAVRAILKKFGKKKDGKTGPVTKPETKLGQEKLYPVVGQSTGQATKLTPIIEQQVLSSSNPELLVPTESPAEYQEKLVGGNNNKSGFELKVGYSEDIKNLLEGGEREKKEKELKERELDLKFFTNKQI